MASSSSPAAPLLPPCQDEQDKEDAGARSDGGSQREQGVMRSWAEAALLCCGADCGDAERLWRRVVLRKWLNVGAGSGDSDFSADEFEAEAETDDEEPGHQEKCCCWEHKLFDEERRSRGLGAGTIGNQVKAVPDRLKRCNSETLRAQYIDVAELRIFVGTWNVGGRVPPIDLDIQEWLAMEEPADIYVLGFQEIVPLNAGNIFGAEDDHPVVVWEHIIRETLNKICPYKPKHKCVSDPPSPSKFNPSDYLVMEDDFLSEADNGSEGELHPLIGQDINPVTNDSGVCKTYEYSTSASSERVHEGEDFSKMLPVHLLQNSTSVTSVKTLTASASFKSRHENSNGFPEDNLDHDVSTDNRVVERKNSNFVRIISKQMVGIYLSVWVQRGLRRHIQNLRVSTVGVGAMGYIGNKGSISVSMSIYQTPFCFVCCHLTSGEKDGNLTKRNADVEEILRRTVFNPVHRVSMPKGIHDHEKIIWFGDLNYRINLSYERTHELISRKEWDLLFDNDQLKWELMKGRTFDGWIEGVISFPPTYKYEFNSDKYAGDEPISARRRPAWCDRILSYGKGIRLDSYRRVELNLSDHRPVSAVYMAEVEVLCHRKFQKAVTFTNVEVEDHLLLER
ncbi:type I inositol polyphosphate 5-phosphatase 1-like isoform X2 [Triticum dicoccoides]|uniref:type I inositol polyphosphate 5-phosphatase 1-like isoform X2 n=1 Tax=Triticum dicoccoides TaxID=85692 RepID=UPI000E7BD8C6|nr:type I inositol polyphosphate 5-phosphatase 1-like isoform X2 [Triticum dicoccoides]